jgi:hypothetical protein
MCDICDRVKRELVRAKKTIDDLTQNKDVEHPINIDMVKTTKAMTYESIRQVYKRMKNKD